MRDCSSMYCRLSVLLLSSCCRRFEMDLKKDSWVDGCGDAVDEVAVPPRFESLELWEELLRAPDDLLVGETGGDVVFDIELGGRVVVCAVGPGVEASEDASVWAGKVPELPSLIPGTDVPFARVGDVAVVGLGDGGVVEVVDAGMTSP